MTIGGQFIESEANATEVRSWGPRQKFTPSITDEVRDGDWYEQRSREYLEWRKNFEGIWTIVEDSYRRYNLQMKGTPRELLNQVYPGRVYRIVHMSEAAVVGPGIKFFLKGYNPQVGEGGVEVCEDLTNAEWEIESRLMRENRLTARDAGKYGFGIVMTSYEADFEKIAKADKREEMRREMSENPQLAATKDNAAAAVAIAESIKPEELRSPTFEMDTRILREEIVTRRISPWHFGVDPDATCLADAQRVWRYIFAPLDAVKNYEFFSNTEDLKPTSWIDYQKAVGFDSRPQNEFTRKRTTNQSNKILLIEFYEKTDEGKWSMVVIAHGQNKILRTVESPYWMGHPFSMLSWNDDGDCIFPQSDIQPVHSEILAERLLMTKAIDGYSREQMDMTFYASGILKEEHLNPAVQPEVGTFVPVDLQNNQRLQDSIMRLPTQPKSSDMLTYLSGIERSIMQSAGFSPAQFGQPLKSGTTASESNSIASYATQAQAHKLGGMELFLSDVAFKRLALACQFYDAAKIGRLLGPTAATKWASLKWTEADVQNGLQVCLKPGATRQVNDDVRAQQLMALLGLLQNDPTMAMAVDKRELYRQLLRAMGFHDGSKILLPVSTQQITDIDASKQLLEATMGGGGAGGSLPAVSAPPSSESGATQGLQS